MKKPELLAVFFLLSIICTACGPGESSDKRIAITKASTTGTMSQGATNDEQKFRELFQKFKEALAARNLRAASTMMHFPFFTGQDQQEMGPANDPISYTEFAQYSAAIFNADVLRVLPACKEDDLSEINDKGTEAYYKSLKKFTDRGSKMYEIYMQYPETNTHAESFFGFVFGRISGEFKVMATYSKWPIK